VTSSPHRTAWRPRSVPEQLALVGLACVPAAFVWPAVHDATGAELLCPLRTLTGVPCPLCGMTRAATSLAAGDLGASLAYNPFLLVLALATAVMTVLMAGRALGVVRPARPLAERARRSVTVVVVAGAAASWLVQLDRYGWL
jgi:Protein of unknown function (DUF2752)